MRPAERPGPSRLTSGANPRSGGDSRGISTANGSVPARSLFYLTADRLHQISRSHVRPRLATPAGSSMTAASLPAPS